jgi:hypothetical protein
VADSTGLHNTGAMRTAPGAKGPSDKEIAVAHSTPLEVLGCPDSQRSQRYAVPYTSSSPHRGKEQCAAARQPLQGAHGKSASCDPLGRNRGGE